MHSLFIKGKFTKIEWLEAEVKLEKQQAKSTFSIFVELSKLNILSLVLVSTFLGYYLGNNGIGSWSLLGFTLLGTAMTSAGAGALNHYLERKPDQLMTRTKNRPIAVGSISPLSVIIYGVSMVVIGSVILVSQVNMLTGFLSLLTAFLYIAIYTPLKRITWLNTSIGSIPGAMPIIGGWTAATGEIGTMAWILFGIMYLWQHPHFYAIAWMCKDDYAAADIPMLPVTHGVAFTRLHILLYTILLFIVTMLPYLVGMSGVFYLIGAVLLGLGFLYYTILMYFNHEDQLAMQTFSYSIVYLMLLFTFLLVDHYIPMIVNSW